MNVLDTGILINMIKNQKYSPGAISPLTLIEPLRGIEDSKRAKVKHLLDESFTILNIDTKIIETYCEIYGKLKKEGNTLPDADLLIAATAMAYNLPLETTDTHFQRLIPLGLKLRQ